MREFAKGRQRILPALCLFYAIAGLAHIACPAPFISITPGWVPFPTQTILATGLCELAGAAGLALRQTRKSAAIGLSAYAACVFPANINHAVDSLTASDATLNAWLYHLPRLALQPVIVWLPLFACGLIAWPFRK